jgi:hypothetical protein
MRAKAMKNEEKEGKKSNGGCRAEEKHQISKPSPPPARATPEGQRQAAQHNRKKKDEMGNE